jgi:hypothetical protein
MKLLSLQVISASPKRENLKIYFNRDLFTEGVNCEMVGEFPPLRIQQKGQETMQKPINW